MRCRQVSIIYVIVENLDPKPIGDQTCFEFQAGENLSLESLCIHVSHSLPYAFDGLL